MRFTKTFFIFSAALFFALMAGCAKPPTEEMDAARDALTRAENNANAVNYAEGTLRRARSALETMYQEAEAKRYDSAKTYAAEALAAAERAVSEGQAAAVKAADDASNLIVSAKTEIQAAEQALDAARQRGLGNVNFGALDDSVAEAWKTVEAAEMSLAQGEVRDAGSKAEAARSSAARISLALAEGARAASRKQ
jgi:hypothetical protein